MKPSTNSETRKLEITLEEFCETIQLETTFKNNYEKIIDDFKHAQLLKIGNEKIKRIVFGDAYYKVTGSNIVEKIEESLDYFTNMSNDLLKAIVRQEKQHESMKTLLHKLMESHKSFDNDALAIGRQVQAFLKLQDKKVHPMQWRDIWQAAENGSLLSVKYWRMMTPQNVLEPRTSGGCETPLHLATIHGHLIVVQFLLSLGADPTRRAPRTGMMPIHEACFIGRLDILEAMLAGREEAARLGQVDANQETVLHWAVRSDSLPLVRALVIRRCSLSWERDHQGRTPYDLARWLYHTDIQDYLKQFN